jgi:tRNA modification GTPase
VVGELLSAGARAAEPGEFTRRAFQNGRISLDEAEAIGALLHAESVLGARRAAATLAAGVGAPLEALRQALQDGLALLESGLDFESGETGEVDLGAVADVLARCASRAAALGSRRGGEARLPQVLLVGPANAGKSSLFNALLDRDCALVSPIAGTTRDVLWERLENQGRELLLGDGAGELSTAPDEVDSAAAELLGAAAGCADQLLYVLPVTAALPRTPLPTGTAAVVRTQSDLATAAPSASSYPEGLPIFLTSAVTGEGIPALRAWLLSQGGNADPVPVPLRERCESALATVAAALERAQRQLAGSAPLECLVEDLRAALLAVDQLLGRTAPEAVLDRIFARFCLGK